MSRFTSLNIQPRKESKKTGRSPRIGVDMTGLSKFLAAHDSFASDGTTFDGLITGGLSTQITSDHLGGLVQVSNLSFSVVNPGLFSDLFNGINPENERVQTFLFFDDGTSILDAERVQLFDGNISDFPDITYDTVIFQAEPLDVRNNVLVSPLLTDSDAADTDQGLPEDSRGKTKPIIYGGHTWLKGDDAKSNDTVSTLNNIVPFVYLGVNSSGLPQWLVAKHKVNEILAATGQGQIWGWDDRINRFVRLNAFTVEQNTSDGCIISHAADPLFLDYWYAKGTVTETTSNASLVNEERLVDKAFDSLADFNIPGASGIGDHATATIPFADYDNQGLDDTNDISAVKAYVYGLLIYSGGTGDTDYEITLDGLALNPDQYPTGGTHPEVRSSVTMANGNKADIAKDIDLKLEKQIAAGTEIARYEAYEVYKEIQYLPHRNLPLYFAGKGKEYNSWINDRSTSEDSYTETHADDDGEGNLIENGAGVIESILRDETGIVSDNLGSEILNETDFATHAKWDTIQECDDTGGNATWTFAGGSLNGVLLQTPSNRANAGTADTRYLLTFDLTTSVIPDGNAKLFFNGFADNQNSIISVAAGWPADGRISHEFVTSATAPSQDFYLQLFESTSTQGIFSIDNISTKEVVTLDLDSFNVASNDLSTTKLSFAILEQIESNTLIDSILKTLGSIGHYDELNRFRMRTYVSGDGFGVSDTNFPGPEDVIDFDPQSVFVIETGVNDKIDADDSGPIFTATLTAGTYTGDSLATEVETQLEASGADNYTVTYSSSTGKFTLLNDTGNWRLKWSSGTNITINAGPILGFDIETDDNGATASFTSNFPVFGDSLLFHPIIEDTFTLKKVDDDIVTNFTVEYFQEYVSNRFQKTSTVTDTTFHAETLKQTWRHPYTNDTTTAEFYRDFLKVRLRRKHYEGTLISKLSAVGFEPWDFANIRHPILNGILGNGEENTKWIITDIGLSAETMEYTIGFVES